MKKLLTFFLSTLLAYAVGFDVGWAETVTDVLNQTFTGVSGTSYTPWSGKTGTSGAVYAGQSAGGNSSIQLRSSNNNSGVVTTTSGGKVKSITVVWQSATQGGRTLNVYGKNSAYTAATDLYDTSKQGTLIGTIVKGTSTSITVSDDYQYIGFCSASGAMYLTSVSIVWETSGGTTPEPTTYSLTLPTGLTGGNVTSNQSDNSTIVAGTSVTVTATPDTGYELDWMKANDTDVSNPYTFNINANTTITAAFKETQVTPPSTDQYQLVTDASQLAAGDKIIIVNTGTDGSGKAMSTTQNTNNRGATDVSISNSIITPGSSVQIITLEKDGDNWLFNVGSGYLYAASSGSNHLKTEDTPDDNGNAEATISISSGAATVKFQGTNTRNWLRYNSGSGIFSCYTSGQQDIFIYKKVEATPQANDVYIIGQVNGHDSDPWVSTEGVKMTYNSSNDNYAANIYCTGVNNGTHEGYSLFLFAKSLPYDWNTTSNLYGSGADGSYWGIGGTNESAFDEEIPLYEGSKNSYRLPAGLYTVTVDLDYTGHEYTTKSVKVTKRDVTMTISPNSASFEDTKTVTMASNLTEIGGKIYYTTNGNDPRDPNSGRQEYTGELTIDATTTFKAVAYVGNLYSEVVEKTYTKQPAAPVITPASCTFNEPLTVTITAEEGATIYYTTDGSTPTNESTQYTGSFTVSTTTTVKARAYVDEVYSTIAEATYTYSNVQPSTGDFELVTSADQLVAGNEYIILEAGGNYAMGAIGSNKGASTNAYTLNGTLGATGSTVSLSTGSDVNVLTLGGEEGAWTLQQSDNSYVSISGNSTNITSSSSAATVTIAIDNNNYATIKGYSTRQILYQISGDKFANYASSNANGSDYEKIYLYTRASNAVAAPVFSPNPGLFNVDVDVTISCATDGATIYYTTDGTEPSATNGTEYTGEIIVSESTTFKAIAVKGENASSVVEATYTINKSTTIETVTLTYSEPFTTGIGKFTVDNVSGYSPVWSLDGNYGVKGTAYNAHTNPTNNAAVSRLVSPIIDMTGAVQPELTFSHQINSYFTNVTNQCQLFIRETTDGLSGTWVQLPITFSDPVAAGGWTNDLVDIDLSDYADKMVQISFLYTNPTAGSGAGTWEIQNFVVADNSEYRMVNNIAEFLALENGTKAKFKNPVTVLYDYAQYSSNSYHEYIWVKDGSGYMQFFLQPTLNSSTESALDAKAAYYENGDIIPAGFVVVKNYYENGKYVQAFSAEALEAGFLPATQKGLADPEHMDFDVLNALDASSDTDVATWCNHYVSLEKIKITPKSGKYFSFADENGTVNDCVGYNKYNGDGSLLKDGTTSADVTLPAAGDTYYNVKGIIQLWQGGWELMPIEFTEWKADEVTLRKLCADGEVNNEYIISNNLQVVRADDATNTIWVKDDTGQSIWMTEPNEGDDNYEYEIVGNTRPTQAYYDQSNWCEIVLANGSDAASSFVNKIIKGGMIDGTFVDKLNPKMTGVTLNADAVTSTATYVPNYYGPANFYSDQHQTCAGPMTGTEGHGTFFFMNPKPQEVARIAWAVYNGTQMALPAQGATGEYTDNQGGTHEIQLNGHGFQGAFKVNMGLNADQTVTLKQGKGYSNFDAIIRLETTGGSGAPMLKAAKPDGANYVVYPLNITGETLTGIDAITVNDASRQVVATEYYNVAGQRSDRPVEGVNIIVTRYSDGSTTTAKVLK